MNRLAFRLPRQYCLLLAALWCVLTPAAEGSMIVCGPTTVRFAKVHFDNVTLEEAFSALHQIPAIHLYVQGREGGINFVLDKRHLTAEQLTRRLSFHEEDITATEIVYVMCRRFGVGFADEPFAVKIASRDQLPLPDPPSRRVCGLPDGAPPKRYLVVVVSPK